MWNFFTLWSSLSVDKFLHQFSQRVPPARGTRGDKYQVCSLPTTLPLPSPDTSLAKRAPLTFFQLPALKLWSQSWTRSLIWMTPDVLTVHWDRRESLIILLKQVVDKNQEEFAKLASTYCWWGWQAGRSGTRGWGLLSLDRAQPVSLGMKKSAHFSQHWSSTQRFNLNTSTNTCVQFSLK